MSRYIDADHLIKRATNPYGDCWSSTCESTADFVDYINEEPTADVKPIVRSEWISKDISDFVYCSNCDYKEWYSNINNYCPNCGANMRRMTNEEARRMSIDEAISYLKWVRPIKPYSLDKKRVQEAIDMAIKALEYMYEDWEEYEEYCKRKESEGKKYELLH